MTYKQQKFLSPVLETECPGLGCQHGPVLVKVLFWVADIWLCSHGGRDEGSLWGLVESANAMGSNAEGSSLET